jgi:hypothetical protein
MTDSPYWSSTPRFTCSSCVLRLEGHRNHWFGPMKGTARARCNGCGEDIQREVGVQGRPAVVNVRCRSCAAVTQAPVSWSNAKSAAPCEPAFGLELRLQAPCASHLLWAYNPAHLEFIGAYIRADMRQRASNVNSSLASRLPGWMKSAKHRDDIERAISVLRHAIL